MDRHQNLLPRQILRKGFYRLEGMWRTKKPARRPVVYRPDESERSWCAWTEVRWRMASRLYGSGLPLTEYAGCASGTSDSEQDQVQ